MKTLTFGVATNIIKVLIDLEQINIFMAHFSSHATARMLKFKMSAFQLFF